MSQYEQCINLIGQKITIHDEDRPIYTKDFDIIRDYVLKIMKNCSHPFKVLFKGASLFGSYSNNVRIKCPDEFDVHITLSPPYSSLLFVEEDEDRPGFVNLNFENVLEKIEDASGLSDVYDLLYDLTDNNFYLVRGKVQRWLKGLIENALEDYGDFVTGSCNDIYTLEYSKRGLAHTIFAHCPARKISIDLVPAFIFGQEDWMTLPQEHIFQFKCHRWYAVPKPTKGPKETRRIAFMICNPKAEHDLLLNKYNMKVVFRLLKSLRDAYGLKRIKSYFITTVFLWEIKKQKESFWRNSIGYLFIHMLDVLTDYFVDDFLPFFWNSNLDLLEILYEEEKEFYKSSLISAYNKLSSYEFQPKIRYETIAQHFDI